MKNIQIIYRGNNCEYLIFATTDKAFDVIFPDAQDSEFIEDFIERVGEIVAGQVTEAMWKRPVNKKFAQGIHGSLFYQLQEKRQYYPTKKESEMVPTWR